MNTVRCEKLIIAVSLLTLSLAALPLLIPVTGAVVVDRGEQVYALPAVPDLAVTNVSLENHTIPSRFQAGPTLIDVRIGVNERSLPAPKGEMAQGPRTIGFTTTPASLAVVIIAVVAVTGAVGAYFVFRRKKDEETEE